MTRRHWAPWFFRVATRLVRWWKSFYHVSAPIDPKNQRPRWDLCTFLLLPFHVCLTSAVLCNFEKCCIKSRCQHLLCRHLQIIKSGPKSRPQLHISTYIMLFRCHWSKHEEISWFMLQISCNVLHHWSKVCPGRYRIAWFSFDCCSYSKRGRLIL